MKVSVAMVTHNHAGYIAQAIESALAQDLGDACELVIGDDCSTDGTRAIAESYGRAHSRRMRVLPAGPRLGPRPNYVRTLQACSGEYVAQLDGDDYWIHPGKLRRQVELLEAQTDLAWCFHATREEDEILGRSTVWHAEGRRARYALADLARGYLCSSCAVVFRRGLFGEFPEWFHAAPFGDWPLQVLNARHGDIGYIDEVWAVHRLHSRGVWAGRSEIEKLHGLQATREYIRRFLEPDCAQAIAEGSFADHYGLAREHERAGELDRAREYLAWCRTHLGDRGAISARRVWRRSLRVGLKSWLRRNGPRGG